MTTERPETRRAHPRGLTSAVPTPRSGVPTAGFGVAAGMRQPAVVVTPSTHAEPEGGRAVLVGVVVLVLVTVAALVVVLQILVPGSPTPSGAPALQRSSTQVTEQPGSLVAFGQAHTYGDGLEVVVGVPQPYEASDNATGTEQGVPLRVQVVISNGTEDGFRPNTMQVAATSGGQEAVGVWDPDQAVGLTGPDLTIPVGGTLQFALAFAASDPADLRLELTPALYGYGPMIVGAS